mmetsp:Transcript_35839/g.108316  ORF Transcript_35839/g.108316 Transcript_35839/m.108316 type:complete len:265 (-) Transcript_35839:577-1371(-)
MLAHEGPPAELTMLNWWATSQPGGATSISAPDADDLSSFDSLPPKSSPTPDTTDSSSPACSAPANGTHWAPCAGGCSSPPGAKRTPTRKPGCATVLPGASGAPRSACWANSVRRSTMKRSTGTGVASARSNAVGRSLTGARLPPPLTSRVAPRSRAASATGITAESFRPPMGAPTTASSTALLWMTVTPSAATQHSPASQCIANKASDASFSSAHSCMLATKCCSAWNNSRRVCWSLQAANKMNERTPPLVIQHSPGVGCNILR